MLWRPAYVSYDDRRRTLYISLKIGSDVDKTVEDAGAVKLDFKEGKLVGIEITLGKNVGEIKF